MADIVYDVMVRVDYDYENEYGDGRKAWGAWVGELTSDGKASDIQLATWAAENIVIPKMAPPDNDMVRLVSTSITTYTVNEAKNV
jgi:hypothetical protein